jgi:hypothetical protein
VIDAVVRESVADSPAVRSLLDALTRAAKSVAAGKP